MTEPRFDWTTQSPNVLAEKYMEYRDARQSLTAQADECGRVLKEIGDAMLAHMQETGADSYRVPGVATVSRTTRTNVSCSDWDTFFNWLLDRANTYAAEGKDPTTVFSFLQKRLSSTEVKDFMDANDNVPPPATNVMPEYAVSVRINRK